MKIVPEHSMNYEQNDKKWEIIAYQMILVINWKCGRTKKSKHGSFILFSAFQLHVSDFNSLLNSQHYKGSQTNKIIFAYSISFILMNQNLDFTSG